jgi:hypothetical protein
MAAASSLETSINIYQDRQHHIPEGPDFDASGRRRRLEDDNERDLRETRCEGWKGEMWLRIEKRGKILRTR